MHSQYAGDCGIDMFVYDGDKVSVAQKYKANLKEQRDNATRMI